MELTFTINFIFSQEIPEPMRTMVTNEFVERRNYACDLLNPCYDKWNEEFDKLYPDLDGTTDEYGKFITNKQDEILKQVNKRRFGLNLTTIDSMKETGDYGDLICRLRFNPNIFVRAELIPVQ